MKLDTSTKNHVNEMRYIGEAEHIAETGHINDFVTQLLSYKKKVRQHLISFSCCRLVRWGLFS
jgi:hypothetical protein